MGMSLCAAGQRLMKIVHDFVHLAPQPREEIQQQDLLIEWKDVSGVNGNGHDRS
jgi:hypothetical protein